MSPFRIMLAEIRHRKLNFIMSLFAVVTGAMSIGDVRGNRRVPSAVLEAIKREMGGTSS